MGISQTLFTYGGIGRRKTAVANICLYKTKDELIFKINDSLATTYLSANPSLFASAQAPLDLLNIKEGFFIQVSVKGGGLTGQAEAIKLGLSRALYQYNKDYHALLRSEGFLTRDSRKVERKKYGLKKARKAPQYSKR